LAAVLRVPVLWMAAMRMAVLVRPPVAARGPVVGSRQRPD
jgi:hypothetical protein